MASPWIALAPVTVAIVLLVEPVRTALPEAVPVTAPVKSPTKLVAVNAPELELKVKLLPD